MAKATATCTCIKCSNTFYRYATKANRREADSWVQWAEANINLCPDCYNAERMERARGGAELCELEGSPKQVAWAEDIRDKFLKSTTANTNKLYQATRRFAVEHINSAKWWIERRNDFHQAINEVYAANKEAIKETLDNEN